MEFSFDVNYVLPYEVTIFNGDYRILNQGQSTRVLYVVKSIFILINVYVLIFLSAVEKLTAIIDVIGEASYRVKTIMNQKNNNKLFYLGTGIIRCSNNSKKISNI
jgi:hypothetical protein